MSRVHCDKKLTRRISIEIKKEYNDYLDDLRVDFQNMCGYCGKPTNITRCVFEIDHFVPQKLDKSKINDYNNLVYSCFQCNRKKGKKWPTNDTNIPNNGRIGFVDPASDEYDNHLERTPSGDIVGKTAVGNYMVNAFAFDKRPMREIWQLMKLDKEKDRLLKSSSNNPDILKCWQEVAIEIDNLLKYMFNCKE